MFAKEWWEARWKILVGAVGAIPAAMIVSAYLPPYETTGRVVERFADEVALGQLLNIYEGGGVALALLAILLGTAAVSEEVGRGTIFFLLSKPASRARTLLTKYAVSAGILLLAATLGHVMLIFAAIARGYPPGLLSVQGVVLSTALIWLGSLSMLGLAMLFSIAFGSTLASLAVTFVTVYLGLYHLSDLAAPFVSYEVFAKAAPLYSWTSATLYAGEGLAPFNFLACTAVAAALLVAPLWVFWRKAY